ncbi:unnamed protein product [Cochlearia groenlandica]
MVLLVMKDQNGIIDSQDTKLRDGLHCIRCESQGEVVMLLVDIMSVQDLQLEGIKTTTKGNLKWIIQRQGEVLGELKGGFRCD